MSSAVMVAQPSVVARVESLARELSSCVATMDIEELSGRAALDATEVFARVERLAMAGKTLAAGRAAETGAWRAAGFDSAARWLAARTKATPTEAGRTLATAQHLSADELAPTRDALVTGTLNATQAHELASAVSRRPEEQERLLGLAARETVSQLRDECRKVRLARREAEDPEARRERIVGEMRFGHREVGDGLSELTARMPTSWLALVLAAVNEQCEAVFARARAEGRRDPHQVYLVEALVTLLLFGVISEGSGPGGADDGGAEGASAGGAEEGPGGEGDGDAGADGDGCGLGSRGGGAVLDDGDGVAGGTDADGRVDAVVIDDVYEELLAAIRGRAAPPRPPRRERRARAQRGRCRCGGRVVPRAKILIRVDQAALLRGHAEPGELCDISGVGPVPVSTVRELWPDAVAKLVITRGVDVLNVTSLSRRATEAMASAMQFTMPRCTNIACDNDRFVELDHRVGWSNVHRTRLDELDPLCSRCHWRKTHENWQLVAGVGRRPLVPPEHPDHPGGPATPAWRPDGGAG